MFTDEPKRSLLIEAICILVHLVAVDHPVVELRRKIKVDWVACCWDVEDLAYDAFEGIFVAELEG